jgi:hypothetical protein
MQVLATVEEALVARIASVAPAAVRADPIASAVVIFRAAQAQVTGTPSEAVPGDLMDPVRAATAIVVSRAWDLAAEVSAGAASIVAAGASEAAVADSAAAVEVSEVAAVGVAAEAVAAGKRCES